MGDLTAEGHAPGLELCRLLLANGFDPAAPLHIYRDGVLALRIRSIGAGAALSVQDDATGRPRFYSLSDTGLMRSKQNPSDRPRGSVACWYEGSRTAKRSLPPIVAWAGRQAFPATSTRT